MLAIGIDPGYSSSKTGIAVAVDRTVYSYARFLEGEFPGQRIKCFRDMLLEEVLKIRKGHYGTKDIGMLTWEEPYAGRINAAKALGYLEGTLYLLCEDLLIPYYPVHNSTLKKVICGSGGVKKPGMLAKASELAGRAIECQDEADAVLCAFYARYVLENRCEEVK